MEPRIAPKPTEHLAQHAPDALERRLLEAGGAKGAVRRALRTVLAAAFREPSREHEGTGPSLDLAGLARDGAGPRVVTALADLCTEPSLGLASVAPAADGTVRLLLEAQDGRLVESVIIPASSPDARQGRTTLCVSSQAGCSRACTFCETGRLGLERQLSTAEIVDQVRVARALWASRGGAPPISNLVFMGMGEPFDNLAEVLPALSLLTDDRAFAYAAARVTVSTVGVVDKLPVFFAGTKARLAVSLNAPDDERRSAIMPVNKRFPLSALREALLLHVPPTRKLLLEYVLFDGWNEQPGDAEKIAAFAAGLPARVNLIPANPGPDPALRAPSPETVDRFASELAALGVRVLVRRPRGREVGGACGQLAGARRGADANGRLRLALARTER